jgi:hypothetical protein
MPDEGTDPSGTVIEQFAAVASARHGFALAESGGRGALQHGKAVNLRPGADHDLSRLHEIAATGAPVAAPLYDWVAGAAGPDIGLTSILRRHRRRQCLLGRQGDWAARTSHGSSSPRSRSRPSTTPSRKLLARSTNSVPPARWS